MKFSNVNELVLCTSIIHASCTASGKGYCTSHQEHTNSPVENGYISLKNIPHYSGTTHYTWDKVA